MVMLLYAGVKPHHVLWPGTLHKKTDRFFPGLLTNAQTVKQNDPAAGIACTS